MPKTLEVCLHDKLAGRLSQEDDGRLSFAYTPDWLALPGAEALSHNLPLRPEAFPHGPARAFFGGVLPEGEVRARLARLLGVSERNDFSLLAEIGGDCAGAVSLRAPGSGNPPAGPRKRKPLNAADLERILKQLPDKPLLTGEGVRLSLAGAQDKLALAGEAGAYSLPAADEPTTQILKIATGGLDQILENELFCLRLAKAMDIPVVEAALEKAGAIPCLSVKRYDRDKDEAGIVRRIHQEDFCQALGKVPENKYQAESGPGIADCAGLVRDASTYGAADLERLLRLVMFNFLIGNADAHSKNFSFLRRPGLVAMAPAYDLICTAVYPNLSPKMAMKVGGKYDPLQVTQRHWRELAEQAEVRPNYLVQALAGMAGQIISRASVVAESLEHEAGARGVFGKIQEVIRERAKRALR
jgi:serine/threonine-protein kinase HipA